jgi:regulator of protease activity HflC (stomatin/prohibitin superfamily)
MSEFKAWYVNGFLALLLSLVSIAAGVALIIFGGSHVEPNSGLIVLGIALIVLFFVAVSSLTVVQPNQAKVITFFGSYKGTVMESGLWMLFPFTVKTKISLKVRNFNSQKLKVNDAEGNPIENGIELDTERRAAMINNLMVAIVSDRGATPVITLYT